MDGDYFKTKDFRMAGFLIGRGAKFHGACVEAGSVDVTFTFEDGDTLGDVRASMLAIQYPTSQEQRYDAACRVMHDMVKSRTRKK